MCRRIGQQDTCAVPYRLSSPPGQPRPVSLFSGQGGCFLVQSQKRGISNCPGNQEFCQRGRNSSRSDWRLLRSSDRPLGAAGFLTSGAVRNITVFSNGSENIPPCPEKRETGRGCPGGEESRYGTAQVSCWPILLHTVCLRAWQWDMQDFPSPCRKIFFCRQGTGRKI